MFILTPIGQRIQILCTQQKLYVFIYAICCFYCLGVPSLRYFLLSNFKLSFTANLELQWFCFASLFDWFKKCLPPSPPIQEAICNLVTCSFLSFRRFACVCFDLLSALVMFTFGFSDCCDYSCHSLLNSTENMFDFMFWLDFCVSCTVGHGCSRAGQCLVTDSSQSRKLFPTF